MSGGKDSTAILLDARELEVSNLSAVGEPKGTDHNFGPSIIGQSHNRGLSPFPRVPVSTLADDPPEPDDEIETPR